MWSRGIFRRERTAWAALGLYVVCLYSTLSLAFDLYVALYAKLGRSTVSTSMNLAFALVGLALLLWAIRRYRPSATGFAVLLLIGAVLFACLKWLDVPAKRFHFFEYSVLAFLAFDALRFRFTRWSLALVSIGLVGLVGLGDEAIQAALPRRHFGFVDLGVNLTAGILTVLFIMQVVREPNYPWGSRRVHSTGGEGSSGATRRDS